MVLIIGKVIPYYDEEDDKTYVSHGINTDTGECIVLPQDEYKRFVYENCFLNTNTNEYVIK